MKLQTNHDGSATITMPESGSVMIRCVVPGPPVPQGPLRDARGRYRRRATSDSVTLTAEDFGEPVWTMEVL